MKLIIWMETTSLAVMSVLIGFAAPEFLVDWAWAEQVNINGQYSCAQIKEECSKAGGKYSHIEQPNGDENCSCYKPCGGKAQGCDVMCSNPKTPGAFNVSHCVGHIPDAISLGNQLTFTPTQILGTAAPRMNAPPLMRRSIDEGQPTPSEQEGK
jgi:hypothetical protein